MSDEEGMLRTKGGRESDIRNKRGREAAFTSAGWGVSVGKKNLGAEKRGLARKRRGTSTGGERFRTQGKRAEKEKAPFHRTVCLGGGGTDFKKAREFARGGSEGRGEKSGEKICENARTTHELSPRNDSNWGGGALGEKFFPDQEGNASANMIEKQRGRMHRV